MLSEFLTAIQARLTGNAGLIAVVPAARIGNHVLDDAAFPHIQWRLEGVEDGKVKSEHSYVGNIVLDVFSDYNGDLQCYQIHDLIYTALQRQKLTGSGFSNPFISFKSIDISVDGDNRTRQATITFAFMVGI